MTTLSPGTTARYEEFYRRMQKYDEEDEQRARDNGFESSEAQEKAAKEEYEKNMIEYNNYKLAHPELFGPYDLLPGDGALRPVTPEEWSLCDCDGEKFLISLSPNIVLTYLICDHRSHCAILLPEKTCSISFYGSSRRSGSIFTSSTHKLSN